VLEGGELGWMVDALDGVVGVVLFAATSPTLLLLE